MIGFPFYRFVAGVPCLTSGSPFTRRLLLEKKRRISSGRDCREMRTPALRFTISFAVKQHMFFDERINRQIERKKLSTVGFLFISEPASNIFRSGVA